MGRHRYFWSRSLRAVVILGVWLLAALVVYNPVANRYRSEPAWRLLLQQSALAIVVAGLLGISLGLVTLILLRRANSPENAYASLFSPWAFRALIAFYMISGIFHYGIRVNDITDAWVISLALIGLIFFVGWAGYMVYDSVCDAKLIKFFKEHPKVAEIFRNPTTTTAE